jgi:hypothetical protein
MGLLRRKSETDQARSHAEQAAAALAAQRGAAEPEPDLEEAIAQEEAHDGRDFKTGAPLPASLPEELRMSRRERARAEYEAQERIVDRMREKLQHAGAHVRPGAIRNLEREEAKLDALHRELYPCVTNEEYEQSLPFAPGICLSRDCDEPVTRKEAYEQAGRCARCFWIGQHASTHGHLNPYRKEAYE